MRPIHAVVLLLAAAFLVWMLRPDATTSAVPDPTPETGSAEAPADLRGADALPTEAEPALVPDTEAPVDAGPLHVQVLGVGGLPIPDAFVGLRPRGPESSLIGKARGTDGRGRVRFDDVPYDGSRELVFFRSDPYVAPGNTVWRSLPAAPGGNDVVVITGPEVVYRAASGLPWRVEVVDALTGARVEDVQLRPRRARGEDADAWTQPPHAWMVVADVGRVRAFSFEVRPPEDLLAWEQPRAAARISPFARAIRQVHPLHHRIPVVVHADARGGGAVTATIQGIRVGGRTHPGLTWKRDAHGRLHVEGVPFLPGEFVAIDVSREDGRGWQRLRERIPSDPSARIVLSVSLGDDEPFEGPENNGTIGIGGSGSAALRLGKPPDNRLEVSVLRMGGQPAAGVELTAANQRAVTDARGRAVLAGVKPGTVVVRARAAGLLPLTREIEMPAEGTVRLELREGRGAALQVEVVDGEGEPLSFARVEVEQPSGTPWVDLEDGVQRVDPFTDHLGRRTLRHVETGDVELTVSWGSRHRRLELPGLEAGERRLVRVLLPEPRDPGR